jgi:hypothetical protein
MVSVEQILYIIPILALAASIFYYGMILRNAENAKRREQLFLRIQSADLSYSKAWTNVIFKKAPTREEWKKVYDPVNNPELFAEMIFIQARFQSLGVMLKEKIIEPDLLYKIYTPNSILVTWEHYRPNFLARREETNDPNLWSEFEFLYNETKKRFPNIKPSTRDF